MPTFDAGIAFDPYNPSVVAAGAELLIFHPGDTDQVPIELFDSSGLPLVNPIITNELGAYPAFIADTDRVAWSGGGLSALLTSYEGIKDVAVEAAGYAQSVVRRADEGEFKGEPGGPGRDGSNILPTEEAIVQAVVMPGGAIEESLNARYVAQSTDRMRVGEGALSSLPESYDGGPYMTLVAIGKDAMAAVEAGSGAIAIGTGAMSAGSKTFDNIALGSSALKHVNAAEAEYQQNNAAGSRNIGVGGNAGHFIEGGYNHVAIGRNAAHCLVNGWGLVAIGAGANIGHAPIGLDGEIMNGAPWGNPGERIYTTAIGSEAANTNLSPSTVAVGGEALKANKKSHNNSALGAMALRKLDANTGNHGGSYTAKGTTGTYSQTGNDITVTVVGHGLLAGDYAYVRLLTGSSATFANDVVPVVVTAVPTADAFMFSHPVYRSALGDALLVAKESQIQQSANHSNTGIGYAAAINLETGVGNTAVGTGTLGASQATQSTAVGYMALEKASTVTNTVAVGGQALRDTTGNISNATAVGYNALLKAVDGTTTPSAWTNIAGFGFESRVSGSNQIQLGNASTTTHVYGTIQNRSDARDKADIRDTELGLEFIGMLRPVDFRWDMREDYTEISVDGTTIRHPRDGSRKRTRFHHGLIAQEVRDVAARYGVEFGGLQDHSISGGAEVMSIGYDELLAPLIRSVQELAGRLEELEK